jgi:multiple sugar transport system permease protein
LATSRTEQRWIARRFRRPRRSVAVEDRTTLVGHSWFTPYLLPGPSILMVSLLLAFPVVYAIWGSVLDTEFLGGPEEFVGLQHYIDLFQDSDFLWTIARSMIFLTGSLVLGLALSLLFAFALNKAAGYLRFLRGVTIVPYLVSGVATAVMFRLLFNTEFGQVNRTLQFFGIEGPAWFASPTFAMAATIIAQVWSDLPLGVLLLLGGLQTIDPTLLDAADVDGATGWQRARYVSIPLITPQLALATAWLSYSTLTSLGVVLALTGGGPVNATNTLPIELYETAFQDLALNEALAIVIVILALNALLTLIYVQMSRRFDIGN